MIEARAGAVGKVLPNLHCRIAEDGEILVKGPSVMKGYYNNPEATAESIVVGWFHTGDIGEMDSQGYLKVIDSSKCIVVLSSCVMFTPVQLYRAINTRCYV